jgi:predicted permease
VKPGVPPERIAAEVNAVFMRLAEEQPEFYSKSQRAVVTPIAVYWTGSARAHLWVMLAASILLLIAGVVSAGNLLLSRTLARRTEFATRMALGAGRSTLMAQLGIEAAVIALTAGLSGLALARAAIRLLIHLAPPDIPRLNGAGLHAESFLFAAGSAAVAALLCTLLPGWPAIHTPIETALREGGERTSMTRRAGRMRGFFIAAQAGVTVMLLAVASLLVLSYRAMMSADIGFANRDTVTMNLQLRGPGVLSGQAVTVDSRRAFYKLLLDRLRAAPVVTSAAAVLLRPLEGSIGWDAPYRFEFEGEARAGRVLPAANYEVVTPDYFRTVGTALIEGRDFSERDAEGTEPVAIVSRSLSERVRGAGYAPIGHRLWIGKWTRIVGVVGDARYRGIAMAGGDIFVPYRQAAPPTNYIAIRGSGSAGALAGLVRQTLAGMDPNQAIAGVATIGELIDTNAARARFNMSLLMCFGICAAVLAAGAVYSSMSEAMTARAREIAIRNALGAPRPRLVWEMLSRTLWFVLAGEIAGAGTVAAAANLAPELLYRVSARDPMVLGPVALFLFLTATGAALAPAWTAAAADPREMLRAA